jgi:putative ABC transport system permease protein
MVLLFLVIAAAAATLSLSLNVQASATRPYDRLREASKGADVWLNQLEQDVDVEKLNGLSTVEAISGPFPVSWANYGIRNGEKKAQLALVGVPAQLPEFDIPVVTKGRWLAEGGSREIVIDVGVAKWLGLKAGQEITLLAPNASETFTVVGFAVPNGRVPAPFDDPAFAYVLPATLLRFDPEPAGTPEGNDFIQPQDAVAGYQLRTSVRLVDRNAIEPFFREAAAAGLQFAGRPWTDVRDNLKEANEFDVIFLNVFGVFALLASGLIIANAVGGQVLSQTRDIGILKTIGFTPRQVTMALLVQNLTLALAASIVGVLAGLLAAPFFLSKTADLLAVPANAAFDPVLLSIAVLVVAILVAIFTIVPAWRAGRIGAIEALNAGNDQVAGRSRLAVVASKLRLPSVAVVGVKDLGRRPWRTAFTVLALVLAVVTATFSLGIEATFDKTMSDPTVIGGPPYDIAADRDAFDDADARRVIESVPEVESYLPVLHTGARSGRQGFEIQAFEGNLQQPRWRMKEGRMPASKGEAAASTEAARERGLQVGDRLTLQFGGGQACFDPLSPACVQTPVDIEIVGIFPSVDGGILALTRDTVPGDEPPTDYLIRLEPGADSRAAANRLIEGSDGYLDPEVFDETIGDIRSDFRSVLVGLNALLFAVAGLNLLSSLLLGIRERRRDFAILKTVGFTPGQVAQTVFFGSAVLAVVAVAFGLPVGLVATRLMFDVLSSAAGIGTGVGQMPGFLWLAPLVPGAIAIAALATVIPARRAAAVEVAEVLRYE